MPFNMIASQSARAAVRQVRRAGRFALMAAGASIVIAAIGISFAWNGLPGTGMQAGLVLDALALAILSAYVIRGRVLRSPGWGGLAGFCFGGIEIILIAVAGRSIPSPWMVAAIVAAPAAWGALIGWARLTALPVMARWVAAFGTLAAVALSIDADRIFVEDSSFLDLPGVALLGLMGASISFIGGSRWAMARRAPPVHGPVTMGEFRALFETLPIPLIITDVENERVSFANERARIQFGIAGVVGALDVGPVNAIAKVASIFQDPADKARIAKFVRDDGLVENYMMQLRHADGASSWALVSAHRIIVAGTQAIAVSFVDMTDRRATEEALLNSEVRYALISRAANDGIWDWDLSTDQVYYSARWREIADVAPNTRLNTLDDWFKLVHPDDLAGLRDAIDAHVTGKTDQLDVEYRLRRPDGRSCWMQCRAIVLRSQSGAPIRMAGSQADITLRKSYEQNLRNAAYEDRLTGIGNRTLFTHLIESLDSETAIESGAVLLLNVDQFRRVNDNLGTSAGDALLIALARRLVGGLRASDTVARLGADEFAVYLKRIGSPSEAMLFCDTLMSSLCEPFMLGDAQVNLGVSAGLAAGRLGGARSGADLVHHARLALDRSKQLGGSQYILFDDGLLRENKQRQRLSRDLATAGRLGQISLDYQPLIALSGRLAGQVTGFEALMRWRHPELGAIEPGRFVPLAEDAGLIGSLGILAIEQAAEAIARWNGSGLVSPSFSIAVNLSVRQISDAIGIRRLYDLLDRLDLPKGRLKLEITESVLMSDPDEMVKVLSDLRARGIGLSLDDFGTGYSSLSYLHRFPLDVLKVDRSFTAQMLHSPEARRLVRSIIDLGHDLGLSVVAEGVESLAEVNSLRQMGCDFGQGYYFSKPLPTAQAERLLIGNVGQPA